MAFCKHCGASYPADSHFCNSCGAPINEEQAKPLPVITEPEVPKTAETVSAATVMVLGIVGLALGAFSSTLIFGIAGIVVSVMALKKADVYQSEHGMLTGQAKVGHILGSIGKIVGIVGTAIGAIVTVYYAFVFVLWMIASLGYSYY